jgi:hypothetical protein
MALSFFFKEDSSSFPVLFSFFSHILKPYGETGLMRFPPSRPSGDRHAAKAGKCYRMEKGMSRAGMDNEIIGINLAA